MCLLFDELRGFLATWLFVYCSQKLQASWSKHHSQVTRTGINLSTPVTKIASFVQSFVGMPFTSGIAIITNFCVLESRVMSTPPVKSQLSKPSVYLLPYWRSLSWFYQRPNQVKPHPYHDLHGQSIPPVLWPSVNPNCAVAFRSAGILQATFQWISLGSCENRATPSNNIINFGRSLV